MIPTPTDIKFLQKSRLLQIQFNTGETFVLPAVYLRVFSPSAEARYKRAVNKENVNIIDIKPVGNYAVRLIFDDNHQSGIYSWETLYDLAVNYENYWQGYLLQLKERRDTLE